MSGLITRAHSKPVIQLNGVDQWIDTGATMGADWDDTIEIEMLLKTSGNGRTQQLFGNIDSGGDGFGILQNSNFISVQLLAPNGTAISITTSNPFNFDVYSRLKVGYTGTRTAAGVEIYFNDILQDLDSPTNDNLSITFPDVENIIIGRNGQISQWYYEGAISYCKYTLNSVIQLEYEFFEGFGPVLFDSQKNSDAAIFGATWLLSQSGCNYPLAITNGLKNDAGVYDVFNGTTSKVILATTFLSSASDYYVEVQVVPFADQIGYIYCRGSNFTITWEPTQISFRSNGQDVSFAVDLTDYLYTLSTIRFEYNSTTDELECILNGVSLGVEDVSSIDMNFQGGRIGTLSTGFTTSNWFGIINYVDHNNQGRWSAAGGWQDEIGSDNPSAIINLHKQPFPETGIAQLISKEGNFTDFIPANVAGLAKVAPVTLGIGEYIEVTGYVAQTGIINDLNPWLRIGKVTAGPTIQMQIRPQADGTLRIRVSFGVNQYEDFFTHPAGEIMSIRLTQTSNNNYTCEVFDSALVSVRSFSFVESINDFIYQKLNETGGAISSNPMYVTEIDENGSVSNRLNGWVGWMNIGQFEKVFIVEDPANSGQDLFGEPIQKPLDEGAGPIRWNTNKFLETWIETQEVFSYSTFAAFFVFEGRSATEIEPETILLDGRDADNDGVLLWLNANGYPEIQFNGQDLAHNASIASADVQILTFWADTTDLYIRQNGTQLATAAKTGGTIAVTNIMTLFAEAFGTKANFFNELIYQSKYVSRTLTLAEVETLENELIAKYSIP
jgi:hypothetical protein